MSRNGVKSLLKRVEGGGVFSNLIFAVSDPTIPKTVTELEMSSVATSGKVGSFQKFDDIQGVSNCYFRCQKLYIILIALCF